MAFPLCNDAQSIVWSYLSDGERFIVAQFSLWPKTTGNEENWNNAAKDCARYGWLHALRWIRGYAPPLNIDYLAVALAAAKAGDAEVLAASEYWHNSSPETMEDIAAAAGIGGHVDLFEDLIRKYDDATQNTELPKNTIRQLVEHECVECLNVFTDMYHAEDFGILVNIVMNNAIQLDKVKSAEWAFQFKYTNRGGLLTYAASIGAPAMMRFLRQETSPPPEDIIAICKCARGNAINLANEWLAELGMPALQPETQM
jgi:hypothetical protein